MSQQIIEYASLIDALVAVTKRLSTYEDRHGIDSEKFFNQSQQGQLTDDAIFIAWANDYRHYLNIRQALEKKLDHFA